MRSGRFGSRLELPKLVLQVAGLYLEIANVVSGESSFRPRLRILTFGARVLAWQARRQSFGETNSA